MYMYNLYCIWATCIMENILFWYVYCLHLAEWLIGLTKHGICLSVFVPVVCSIVTL